MLRKLNRVGFSTLVAVLACVALLFAAAPVARAQSGSVGTVSVEVVDQAGGVVSGAQLQLRDLSTNDIRNAITEKEGNYNFVNLPIGSYELTISKSGFATQVYDNVVVQAAQTTNVNASIKIATTGSKIEVVGSATPLLETSSNTIGTTIDMKQLEDLPLGGRDLTQLAVTLPGVTTLRNSNNQVYNAIWNGLPPISQGNSVDGIVSSTSRMKFGGNATPAASPRVEDIQEMTVQTDQLDPSQGFGQATTEINFVTRRGSNSYHGRAYEDFQNSYLNANSWYNDAAGLKKGVAKINDFGGSVGGPVKKDRMFFFGSFAERKTPFTAFPSATILSQTEPLCASNAGCSQAQLTSGAGAQSGNYTYLGTDNLFHTANVFQLAQAYNTANGTSLPTTINTVISSQLSQVNSVLSSGTLITPNTNAPATQSLLWSVGAPRVTYFPTVRLDYNISQNLRISGAWNFTDVPTQFSAAPFFPGAAFAGSQQNVLNRNYTGQFGIDWTIRPTLVNQFSGGYLYDDRSFNTTQGALNGPSIFWGFGTSVQQYRLHTGQYYPLISASDTMTWQHGAHAVDVGFSMSREQDHYYNPTGGVWGICLGLAGGDPALKAFTNGAGGTLPAATNGTRGSVRSMYAMLVGDISRAGAGVCGGFAGNGYNGKNPNTGGYNPVTYNLDELQSGWNLYAGDSFRLRPNFTINYSLVWGLTNDDHDLTNAYQGISSVADEYGPSGPGNLFKPGVLNGNPNGGTISAHGHQYHGWYVAPQPQLGIAWTPTFKEGLLGKLAGDGTTVIRAGAAIRRYTLPQQYFWDAAADYAFGYLQQFSYVGSTTVGPGFFTPGTLHLDGTSGKSMLQYDSSSNTNPFGGLGGYVNGSETGSSFAFTPTSFVSSTPESKYTFLSGGPSLKGLNPHIKQPMTESWNFGIQRQLGSSNVLEVRYVGNRNIHQWLAEDLNEVNIFENQFLGEFKHAQQNLAVNAAHGYNGTANPQTFANLGFQGDAPLPTFDAAFSGEAAGVAGFPTDYSDKSYFIPTIQQGQAGSIAYAFTTTGGGGTGAANYYCNLVGSSFAGCANVKFVGLGAGYPINFFQVNPFYSGNQSFYMDSTGYSTYHALQVDFRQKQWHGMQFDANYTWSHNLGLITPNDWQSGFNQISLRDVRLNYGPTIYDLRHVARVSGTYDLPFGKGKMMLAGNRLLDRVVGGWTVGTIVTYQTGAPFSLGGGGYTTFNDIADSGVVLNGVTASQLQNAVGIFRVPVGSSACGGAGKACTFVDTINPALLSSPGGGVPGVGTTSAYAFPNTSAGSVIPPIYLYGPHFWNADMSVTKAVAIRENIRFTLQGEFLNAFNHPNFGTPSSGVLSSNFGTAGTVNSPRAIELRANLEF